MEPFIGYPPPSESTAVSDGAGRPGPTVRSGDGPRCHPGRADTLRIVFRLTVAPVTLDPIRVEARAVEAINPMMTGFKAFKPAGILFTPPCDAGIFPR
jgi:hypothetical protein